MADDVKIELLYYRLGDDDIDEFPYMISLDNGDHIETFIDGFLTSTLDGNIDHWSRRPKREKPVRELQTLGKP